MANRSTDEYPRRIRISILATERPPDRRLSYRSPVKRRWESQDLGRVHPDNRMTLEGWGGACDWIPRTSPHSCGGLPTRSRGGVSARRQASSRVSPVLLRPPNLRLVISSRRLHGSVGPADITSMASYKPSLLPSHTPPPATSLLHPCPTFPIPRVEPCPRARRHRHYRIIV